MNYRHRVSGCVLVCFLVASWSWVSAGDNWPQFRGTNSAGASDSANLPERWSRTENVAWTAEIPGRGWSSPIVWGNRVFVTSAISEGGFKKPSTGIYGNDYMAELLKKGLSQAEAMKLVNDRDIETTDADSAAIRRMVFCIDAETGKILWERQAHRGQAPGGRHRKNTYASETPVTDGERIYAYFGNVGLFCYSMEGEPLWSRSWGPYKVYLDFGTAASPAIHGDHVYLQNDNEEDSFLVALDKKTGRDVWVSHRNEGGRGRKSGWASPFVWQSGSRTEIITTGRGRAISYDTSGSVLWTLNGLTGQATPTPLADSGLLYMGTGAQEGNNRPLFAVRPGGTGDISLKEGETSNEYVAWFQKSAAAYIPSPVIYKNRMYVVFDNGIFSAYDSQTGRQIYKARIGEGIATFSSSPWAYAGKIYCLSEDGDTYVVAAGDEFKEIAKNSLDEMALATPAIAGDSLFIRTATKLFRIKKS